MLLVVMKFFFFFPWIGPCCTSAAVQGCLTLKVDQRMLVQCGSCSITLNKHVKWTSRIRWQAVFRRHKKRKHWWLGSSVLGMGKIGSSRLPTHDDGVLHASDASAVTGSITATVGPVPLTVNVWMPVGGCTLEAVDNSWKVSYRRTRVGYTVTIPLKNPICSATSLGGCFLTKHSIRNHKP